MYRETCSSRSPICRLMIPSSSRSLAANCSMASTNRRGNKGQHCLVPLCILNVSDISLLTLIQALGSVYRSLTHEMNLGPDPNLAIREKKYPHSTESNAFLVSKEAITLQPVLSCYICKVTKSLLRLI